MDFSFKTKEFVEEFEKKCSKLQKKSFNKNEIITTYINKRNQICILIDGEADLVRYDYNGNKTIVEHFTKNELFVKARKKCEVLFFSYKNLKQKCKSNCKFHQILNENISELILNKVILLNTRIELLAKRSIREKLLGYFNVLSTRNFSTTFLLPYSLTDLADYLSVDRSAMMREIKSLKEDGFIKKTGNKITLLYK